MKKLLKKINNWLIKQVVKFVAARYVAAHKRYAMLQLEWLKTLDFKPESRYPDCLSYELDDARATELYWLELLHKVTTYANQTQNN